MKVLYIRLPDKVHEQMVDLAEREGCSLQKLSAAAVSQFLDMAEQHGRFDDDDQGNETEQEITSDCA